MSVRETSSTGLPSRGYVSTSRSAEVLADWNRPLKVTLFHNSTQTGVHCLSFSTLAQSRFFRANNGEQNDSTSTAARIRRIRASNRICADGTHVTIEEGIAMWHFVECHITEGFFWPDPGGFLSFL